MQHNIELRHTLLQSVTLLGVLLLAITEGLGAFGCLRRTPVVIAWMVIASAAVLAFAWYRPRVRVRWRRPDPLILLCAAACIAIVAVTAATALLSPPNSTDAMSYHLPRVIYWVEQSSVRFFPTPFLNQIMLQPFAEYALLHLYLLAQGDQLANLVQWFSSVVSIVAVSYAAGLMGATLRGQAIGALFCATLPSGILASSGAKNDYVMAMWIVAALCFALRFACTSRIMDGVFLGAASGLALLTKGTAYLFLPWLICAVLIARWRPTQRSAWAGGIAAIVCALAVNTPHFVRNYELSGSILGFDSAQADGVFRWRNESLGWKPTASNLVRNLSDQLGARSERWNHSVYQAALTIHQTLGIDPNDPATTWRGTKFEPPVNANHEANAPNRWHFAFLVVAAAILAFRALTGHDRERALYAVALLCGFVAFCAYLKWQPFMARLLLPLFVAAAPLVGIAGDAGRSMTALILQIPLCLLLLDNARLPLLQNWTRPLKGPASILHAKRNDQYFADMGAWNNRDFYLQSVDLIARKRCDTVGIDINNNHLEYPLIALLSERRSGVDFVHTGVTNPSRSYRPPVSTPPCVVACLDCAGDTQRLRLYEDFPKAAVFGRFVILSRE